MTSIVKLETYSMKNEIQNPKSETDINIGMFRFKSNGASFGMFRISGFMFQAPRGGFTLLETIVALALILSAMAGPVTLASRGIFFAKFSKNKLIGANLAQEGLEIVRKMRDDNVLARRAFDLGIFDPINMDREGDVLSPSLSTFIGAALLRDTDSGIYHIPSSGGGTQTIFTRKLTITKPSADELLTVSRVTWEEAGIIRNVTIREILYNWP